MSAPPRIGTRRGRGRTLGGDLATIALTLGYDLHDWQRHAADVSLALTSRPFAPGRSVRRLRSKAVGIVVGRQAGKSVLAEARVWLSALAPDLGLDVGGPVHAQRVGWLAQDRASALRQWDIAVDRLLASDYRATVARVRRQRGDEAVTFMNGSTVRVITPSRMGARGQALDLVLVDEALAHPVELLAALAPTTAARDSAPGSIGAQLVALSTAPVDEGRATLFVTLRELGRRAVAESDVSRCWLEWSAEPGANVYDPETWRGCCPTLDLPGGIASEFLAFQAELLDRETFAAEYLGIASAGPAVTVIDLDAWSRAPQARPLSGLVLGVDARPDGLSACVVAAGRTGDREVVAVEIVEYAEGVDWVPGRVLELAARHKATVIVDRNGPVGWLAPMAARAKADAVAASTAEVIAAASEMALAVDRGALAHPRDPRLDDAVEHATRRRSGDRWMFDRAASDASALIAASLAYWWVVAAPKRPTPRVF